MIRFTLRGIHFRFEFSFFFTAALMILASGETAELALCACILHEAGHFAAMRFFDLKIRRVTFSAFGIKISPERGRFLPPVREIAILSAGCAVNLILSVIFGESLFGIVNLCLCAFNLIPAGGLDGGRIFKCVMDSIFPYEPKRSSDMRKAVSVLCSAALSAFFVLGGFANPSVFIASAFILLSALLD